MLNTEYIEEIKINSYDELVKKKKKKTDLCDDLRDKFIFRAKVKSDLSSGYIKNNFEI